jgi:hypothetical protein
VAEGRIEGSGEVKKVSFLVEELKLRPKPVVVEAVKSGRNGSAGDVT